MPRKPSSVALLVTAAAAVTAATASGCMSVHTPTAPATPPPSVVAPAPRPDGHADRPLVQAPVREALKRTGPSPRHAPAAPHTEAPPPPPERAVTPPRRAAPPKPAPRPAAPKPAPRSVPKPPAQTDVCALGRQYGGWDPDSPQSVICRNAYGS
ncbi:hypothetical protein [Streptomyces sp. NPDC050264]|uniref:hypothetical protein n=1 Tax=Streptomyces sp. NPDC050264 TaxID=3155038 RepID=UPI00342EB983